MEEKSGFFILETKIAGLKYNAGVAIGRKLKKGEVLTLVRDFKNPHDKMAIEIFNSEGIKLGFIPRYWNNFPAAFLDRGIEIYAVVSEVNPEEEPRNMIRIRIFRCS